MQHVFIGRLLPPVQYGIGCHALHENCCRMYCTRHMLTYTVSTLTDGSENCSTSRASISRAVTACLQPPYGSSVMDSLLVQFTVVTLCCSGVLHLLCSVVMYHHKVGTNTSR